MKLKTITFFAIVAMCLAHASPADAQTPQTRGRQAEGIAAAADEAVDRLVKDCGLTEAGAAGLRQTAAKMKSIAAKMVEDEQGIEGKRTEIDFRQSELASQRAELHRLWGLFDPENKALEAEGLRLAKEVDVHNKRWPPNDPTGKKHIFIMPDEAAEESACTADEDRLRTWGAAVVRRADALGELSGKIEAQKVACANTEWELQAKQGAQDRLVDDLKTLDGQFTAAEAEAKKQSEQLAEHLKPVIAPSGESGPKPISPLPTAVRADPRPQLGGAFNQLVDISFNATRGGRPKFDVGVGAGVVVQTIPPAPAVTGAPAYKELAERQRMLEDRLKDRIDAFNAQAAGTDRSKTDSELTALDSQVTELTQQLVWAKYQRNLLESQKPTQAATAVAVQPLILPRSIPKQHETGN